MILDLRKVFITDNLSEPVDISLNLSAVDYMGEFPLKKPVTATGEVFNKAGLVTLRLRMVYVFSSPCDRCGLPTETEYSVPFEKSLAPEIEGEASDDILLVPDMKLDLEDLVYTEVILSLPMKHLCRPDCKGICQMCGKNLNEGACTCKKKEIDPRLQVLADLLNND